MNWFWDALWKLFGEREPKLPPVPRDENMKGLGWRGDRREVKPFDPKKGYDDNGD